MLLEERIEYLKIKEESARAKMAVLGMIRQFYDYPKGEDIKRYVENTGGEYDENNTYYFHLFESAGEKAFSLLGIEGDIIDDDELYSIEKMLREEILKTMEERKNLECDK